MSAYSVNNQAVECITIMMCGNEDSIFHNWSLCLINGYKLLPTMLSSIPDISRRSEYVNTRFRQFHDFSNKYISDYMTSISSVPEYTSLYNKRIEAHDLACKLRKYSNLEIANKDDVPKHGKLRKYVIDRLAGKTPTWNPKLEEELNRFYDINMGKVASIQPELDKVKHEADDLVASFSASDKSGAITPNITMKVALIIFMTNTMSIYNSGGVDSDDNDEKAFFECSHYIIEHFDSIVDGIMNTDESRVYYAYSDVITNYKDILILALRDHIENGYVSVSETTLVRLISRTDELVADLSPTDELVADLSPTYRVPDLSPTYRGPDLSPTYALGSILRRYRNKLSIAHEQLRDVNIIDLLNFKCALYDIQNLSYDQTDIDINAEQINAAVVDWVKTILQVDSDDDVSEVDRILRGAESDRHLGITYNNYDDEINLNKLYFVYKKHQTTLRRTPPKQIAKITARRDARRDSKLLSVQKGTRKGVPKGTLSNDLESMIHNINTQMPSTTPAEKKLKSSMIKMARQYVFNTRPNSITPFEKAYARINAGMNKYHRRTKHKHPIKKSSRKKPSRNKNPVKKYRTKRGKRYSKHKLTRKK
jgi:hypothetical protein